MEQDMRKRTWVIAILVIALCFTLNLVRQQDISALGIAKGLMADMRAGIGDDKLGDAIGKTKEGRRSIAAYWEAHELLHQVKVYKGLPEDHIPLIEALVVNLDRDGYKSNGNVKIETFFDDSKKVGDEWSRNY